MNDGRIIIDKIIADADETVKKIMSLMTKKGVKKTDSEWEKLRSEIETKRI